ncbi:HAL/PAL/TAL family ammonia-lyase [Reichenbachiella ulvae]|uniref:Aromatic amino acid ammonia-lyase n=1 Tax=Reichenbachiella ulvae TaxID=2980104 RepID=A0ABT3CVD1_9BACT|nr:aromatic amino acid ammonia-lyase [Reichenbachiella ulvae]MCV9387193.1 aromatic amino acid ammonia-lyase [Reichenbachiella ulvae]
MGRLTIEKIEEIFDRKDSYRLSSEQKEKIQNSYDFLKEFSKNKVIYGINTGFGPMAQYRISDDKLEELQYNLIHSHCNGTGEYISEEYARIVMVCRLNTLALGYSGSSLQYLETLEKFLEKDIISCIPTHGGVGASGDLLQLAHVAHTLIGHGQVYYKGEVVDTAVALKAEGIEPAKLMLRDGLGAINGTSCMSGIAAVNLIKAKKLIGWAIHASSIMNELTSSYDDSFSSELNNSKLHKGQQKVASIMRDLVKDGSVLKQRNAHLFNEEHIEGQEYFSEKVQEYYSLRCVPQVIGPVLETYEYCKQIVEDEVNSANDNPIICMDTKNVYHGGNFHGDYIALEMDKLKIAVTKLTMLMERQLNFLMHSKLNQIFPPFLNMEKLGFNFGLQGMQFTAVSTTAENQTLSMPMYIHSIPNNGDNQDIVSMGTNAAVMTQKVIDNAFEVLTILTISIAQAIDLSNKIDQKASSTREFYNFVREIVPTLKQDIALHPHQMKLKKKLLNAEKNLF